MEVTIYHGDSGHAEDDTSVGTFTVTGTPPQPAGEPLIDLCFRAEDDDLILSVDAGASSLSVTSADTHVDRLTTGPSESRCGDRA